MLEFKRWGVQEKGVREFGSLLASEFRGWGVRELGGRRWGFRELGSSGDGEFVSLRIQEIRSS